jgi:DNA-binding PadR family transcriptional regulator
MGRSTGVHDGCLTEPRLLILLNLATGPRHGYGIIKDVNALGNSKVTLTTGTVYGGLRELTAMGWLTAVPHDRTKRSKRPSRAYALTTAGRDALVRQVGRMRWLLEVAEKQGL